MVWPIGQPLGRLHDRALRSQQLWREAAAASGVWLNDCGSVHLAHRHDELAVLEEFAAQSAAAGTDCTLLTAEQTLALAPAANPKSSSRHARRSRNSGRATALAIVGEHICL